MLVPDTLEIIKVTLMVGGFARADLAEKLYSLFLAARDQMGCETSYDFGLRSIKGSLTQACHYMEKLKFQAKLDPAEIEAKQAIKEYLAKYKEKCEKAAKGSALGFL